MAVRRERHDAVLVARLDRPAALNALSVGMLEDLADTIAAADSDPGVRAVVLTGTGTKAFCAGADIAHMREATPAEAGEFAALGHRVAATIAEARVPVVAAINGYALGGGCELALACDIRIAATTARIGLPEVTLGIIPGWGGTQRLPRLVGAGFAHEMILTGRMVDADEALRVGLVNHLHEPGALEGAAVEMATTIASRPAGAIARAKQMVASAGDDTLAAGCGREVDAFVALFGHPDQREGMAAFFEKRPPRFHRD